jgi:hypothetical protein
MAAHRQLSDWERENANRDLRPKNEALWSEASRRHIDLHSMSPDTAIIIGCHFHL